MSSDPSTPPPADSVLDAVERATGVEARVSLHDSSAGESPLLTPAPGAAEFVPRRRGEYQIQGEIARGGMGRVLKAHDPDLGRDVAIKVLDPRLVGRADVLRRFVEEAQVGGQLQHPGVVPVYELGLLADERPYFTMKLIKGRTLAFLLAERRAPGDARAELLQIFESVCQTVAYAHSKGVIHRDLKPANVMVGSFGEVQVVDWGLSKVLRRGGLDDELRGRQDGLTRIETVRSGPPGSGTDSLVGSVLGTPAYMPPEQARGDVERLDERADVFALGALLCEILTGLPPYRERDGAPGLVEQASRALLEDAEGRLAACADEPELVALARNCLAPAPSARPRNAEVVARAVREHLAADQARLRKAETEAAAARARAAGERKARRLTVALALSGALATFAIVAGWTLRERRERAEVARIEQGLDALRVQVSQLQASGNSAEALQVARGGLLLAAGRPDRDRLQLSAAAILAEAEAAEAHALARDERAARDAALLLRVDGLRLAAAEELSVAEHAELDADFDAAFRAWGLAVDLDLLESLRSLRASGLAKELAPALDDWASVRRWAYGWTARPAEDLNLLAADLDPDPVRVRLREALVARDEATLLAIAAEPDVLDLPPSTLWVLGNALLDLRHMDLSLDLLEQSVVRHPSDLRLLIAAANSAHRVGRWDLALQHLVVASALRPDLAILRLYLGASLAENGRHPEAVRELRRFLDEESDVRFGYGILAMSFLMLGDDEGVVEVVGRVESERRLRRVDPSGVADDAAVLALARLHLGRIELAAFEAETDELRRITPLAGVICAWGVLDEAPEREHLERALAGLSGLSFRSNEYPLDRLARAELLLALDRPEEALRACRNVEPGERSRTSPLDMHALLACLRARALAGIGRPDEALDWLVEARRAFQELSARDPQAWSASRLAAVLQRAGEELGH